MCAFGLALTSPGAHPELSLSWKQTLPFSLEDSRKNTIVTIVIIIAIIVMTMIMRYMKSM